jgi:WD40 repeat protein
LAARTSIKITRLGELASIVSRPCADPRWTPSHRPACRPTSHIPRSFIPGTLIGPHYRQSSLTSCRAEDNLSVSRGCGRANLGCVWQRLRRWFSDGAARTIVRQLNRTGPSVLGRGVHVNQVEGVAFSGDGRLLATADHGGKLALWDFPRRRLLRVFTDRNFSEVAFTPDARRIAAAGFDSTVRIWSVATGRLLRTIRYPGQTETVAISPDGRFIAGAGSDSTVRVWRVTTGAGKIFAGHTDAVYTVKFSPDGKELISGGRDRTVRVWDAANTRQLGALGFRRQRCGRCLSGWQIARSRGQRWNDLHLDLHSRRKVLTLRGHTDSVHGVSFGPDGRLMVSAGFDRTVRLWSTRNGKLLHLWTPHRAKVSGVAFSPDGHWVVSVASDTTVRACHVPQHLDPR